MAAVVRRTLARKDRPSPRSAEAVDATAGDVVKTTAGEMALQAIDGHQSSECAPQALVQLIGFRDPTAGPKWRRPARGVAR
jgi:hypothetical protein